MGMMKKCNIDGNCPDYQYCYEESKHCANYTLCSMYNRNNAINPARDPSQCGPCVKGYTADTLANGEQSESCKKDLIQKEDPMDTTTYIIFIVVILIVLLFLFVMTKLFYPYIKKWISEHCLNSSNSCLGISIEQVNETVTNNATLVASAPLEEESPFINNTNHCVPYKEIIDNKLQTATVSAPPNWVRNANYGTNRLNDSDDEMDAPQRDHGNHGTLTNRLASITENNPAEQVVIDISRSNVEHDNARNTALMQLLAYSSNLNGRNENSNADSNADSNTDNDTNSTFEPNINGNMRDKNITNIFNVINQACNPNVTVNMVNDYNLS